MPNFENYRSGLAKELISDPDKEARKGKLSEAKRSEEYQNAEREKKDGEKRFQELMKNIKNFRSEDLSIISGKRHKEIALKLIEAGKGDSVACHLPNLSGLDHKEIASKLIEAGECDSVVECLHFFNGLNKEIALKLIEAGNDYSVARNLPLFTGLDKEIALKLIEVGEGDRVAEYLQCFSGLDHKEIASKLIEAGKGDSVSCYLPNFSGLDHKEIALKLIEAGEGDSVVECLHFFTGLDKEIALKLIEVGKDYSVSRNLPNFTGLDKEIALKLIEAGKGDSVVECLRFFNGLNKEIALKLIEAGEDYSVSRNLLLFTGLDKEIALKLIMAGKGDIVDIKFYRFSGLEELKEKSEQCQYLKFLEFIVVEDLKIVDLDSPQEEDFEKIFKILSEQYPDWKDEQNISGPFKGGAECFGYEKMFKFLDRKGLSRHDGLHNFYQIIKAYETSGLKSSEFNNNILRQVADDDSSYYEGTAHHHLNNLVDSINFNLDEVRQKTVQYAEIEKMQELMANLGDFKNIFSSWKNLKKYHEICELLGRTEVLDELKELKEQGKDKLYKYIETLAFHPNINTQAVFQYFKNPAEFLNIDEDHAPEAHRLKKPSNYIYIPNLDLTAENLRDAQVEGDLDKLQAWQPMQIIYAINESDDRKKIEQNEDQDLRMALNHALGKQSVNDGSVKARKRLFSSINKILKNKGKTDLANYLNNPEIEISQEVEKEVRNQIKIFYGSFKKSLENIVQYRAKISLKSDPDAVVAGNDTACCMPFGSGKNNVYTFNPVCAQFILQRKTGDKWRTVAQSVLTKNIDIKTNISDVVTRMQDSDIKLSEIIPEEILTQADHVITCDNVEVAPNYKDKSNSNEIIEAIYRDFFREYAKRYAEEEKLDTEKVIIGTGYSDSLTHLPLVNNQYAPAAPVGYSDNAGSKSLMLSLEPDAETEKKSKVIITDREVTANRKPEAGNQPEISERGVKPLTFFDSLQVAYLEGKAYHDNESLMEQLHNMENGLIAKDINNSAKDRMNMSLKYVDDKGKMRGYIFAYEGVANVNNEDHGDEYYDEDDSDYKQSRDTSLGERVIYIADLAADPTSKTAGGRLIRAFTEIYKKYNLDKNNMVPILAEAREKTSYAIIIKQLERISTSLGVKFNIEEVGDEERGGDVMKRVIIRPEKL